MRSFCPLLILGALTASGSSAAFAADEPGEEAADTGEVVVTATRSRRLVRDQAVRVEVVPQEELEESQTVAPGNLTNLLNELAGARIDAGSAGFGGTSLRLRGMPGRHAQVLSDGLALTGAEAGSLSLLQVSPVDLQRVEVIKGAASALYGSSALAGVMNLVARAPDSPSEMLLSESSLGATDLDVFLAHGTDSRGATLTASANYQPRRDPDHDGWAELAGYDRRTVRPRFYWGDGDDRYFATLGYIGEQRDGGTTGANTIPDGAPFPATLDTRHFDGGFTAHLARGDRVFDVKAYAVQTDHDRNFGATAEDDASTNAAVEASMASNLGAHDLTAGVALRYESLSAPDVPGVHYSYTTPSVFAQDEWSPSKWLEITGSARVDAHSEFGTFVSSRVSALFRVDANLSLRASAGNGFAAATPQVDELEDTGLAPLNPLGRLRAERASSAALDIQWIARPFEVNGSVFGAEVRHPLDVVAATQPDRVELVNGAAPFRVRGAELLVGCVIDDMHLLFNSTWLDADEDAPGGGRRRAARLPTFSAEIATIFELEGLGRAGFELGYTGTQSVDDDPFRTRTAPYFELNALAEVRVGRVFVFLNAFNVTDVRQQDHDPLLRPAASPGLGGTPVTDAWAPLVGRWFSAGARMKF